MKKLGIVLFGVVMMYNMIIASDVRGQKLSSDVKLIERNISTSLNNNIQGIVEASIYNTIFMKKYFPEADFKNILEALNKIALKSDKPGLRYKAQIALMYIQYGFDLNIQISNEKEDRDKTFRKIAEELQDKLLASK